MEQYLLQAKELLTAYGLKVVGAFFIFIIGLIAAKIIKRALRKIFLRSKVEATISSFIINLGYGLFFTFVILMTLNQLGIETTSFIAVLGAAGLAVGFALKDSLSNFSAGIMILIFRQFKVGDYIEGAGAAGTVEEINIFTTRLVSPDNKVIYIPNASLISGSLTNYSAKDKRRVDMIFGIGYKEEIPKAKAVINDILMNDSRVLKDPVHQIVVVSLGDSSVNLAVRPWVKTEDYWGLYFDVIEKVKIRFDEEHISIPFPQRDIHVYNKTN